MRVCFFYSDKPREHILGDAFLEGVKANGDEGFGRSLTPEINVADDCDVVCMVGVKSKELFKAHFSRGIHVVYLDKGYTRHAMRGPIKLWEYWRVALNDHHPTAFLEKSGSPRDRLDRLGLELLPWRSGGDQIVLAGSSAKYHDFYGISEPTRYATKTVNKLRGLSARTIVYRPKPSWKEAVPVPFAQFSQAGTIGDALKGAHALVTHGSNACFDAVLAGIPTLILGTAVTKTISSTEIGEIETPKLASERDRLQLLADLAYCQYSLPEFASGEAWRHLKVQIYG